MAVIPDGRHDVLIVDAQTDEDGNVHFELVLTSGEHKGDVVRILGTADSSGSPSSDPSDPSDPIDLLGLPATLVVENGQPRLSLE